MQSLAQLFLKYFIYLFFSLFAFPAVETVEYVVERTLGDVTNA